MARPSSWNTAVHEATHAVVAHRLGLTVREVKLKGWTRIPRYCAQLYPGLVAGIPIKSPITLLEDDCLDVSPAEVLVAMAAPSYLRTDDAKLNAYSDLERLLAHRYATKIGLNPKMVVDQACHFAAASERRIYVIAELLEQRGGRLDGSDLDFRREAGEDGLDVLRPGLQGFVPVRSVL